MEICTKRGKKFLVHEGHKFWFQKSSADGLREFWCCDKRDSTKCAVRVHSRDGQVVKTLHEHNHDSEPAEIEVTSIKNTIKNRAVNTIELPNQIMNLELQGTSHAVLAKMPKYDAIRKTVQRVRNEIAKAPAKPADLVQLIMPEKYTVYEEEKFLLLDSGSEQQRILVFGRESNTLWFHQIEQMYMDGTFKARKFKKI